MRHKHKQIITIFCCWAAVLMAACFSDPEVVSNKITTAEVFDQATLAKDIELVKPFYKPMQIRSGDWLKTFQESGQTFDEYVKSKPTLPTENRKTIYIQPIGDFSSEQQRILELTAEYMKAFYNLPVKLNATKALGNVPQKLTRKVYPNNVQINTSYFLDDILPKMLPDDAAAFICFTNRDLFPNETMAYVFGQASLAKRVGVWSLKRLDYTSSGKIDGNTFLQRTLKIAMHETGHMFSMRHCIKYECLMSGTNSLDETDRRPMDNCPECMAKVAWAMKYEPKTRYRNLAAFWKKQGNNPENKRFLDMAAALEKK